MTEHYLEDFAVGQKYGSGRLQIDEERIKSFASEFDPQPFHLDAAAAQHTIFQGLVASGWHTAAVTMRLLVEIGLVLIQFGGEAAHLSREFLDLPVVSVDLRLVGSQLPARGFGYDFGRVL